MKKLILIVGPNGVGKSTTAREFFQSNSKCAYVDSDWCRVKNPFSFTESDQKLVANNIFCLLRNYLACEDVEKVIFTYAFHGVRKNIFDIIIARLQDEGIEVELKIIILKCSYDENMNRARADKRDEARIQYGMKNTFDFYDQYNFPVIDTTCMKLEQIVEVINKIIE